MPYGQRGPSRPPQYGGVGVEGAEMHAPPQTPVGGHVMVGVQVEPLGQPVRAPTVQGISGPCVGVAIQRPLHVTVW